jgi:hypothetical protein
MPSDAGELGSMSAAGAAAGVAEPLLAGGRFGVWWFALPLVAGVVIGTFGVLLWAAGHPVWPPVLCVAGGLLLLGSVAGVAIRRTRRWISVLPDGFVIADRDGERHIHDAQVCGLAYHVHPHYSAGRLTAATRQLALWVDSHEPGNSIVLSNRLAPEEDDPLLPLTRRLNVRLKEQAEHLLSRQQPVTGDGWEWNGAEIRFGKAPQASVLALSRIAAVECIAQEVRIWQAGESLPVQRLPGSGRNVWLLAALLQDRIDPQPASTSDAPEHGLGRVLFERRPNPLLAWTILGLGGFAGIVALVCFGTAIAMRSLTPALLGGAVAFSGGMLLIAGRRLCGAMFRCHEHGLCKLGLAGRQELRYEAIDVFSFDARRQRSHGRYAGTLYTLVFSDHTRPGAGIFHSETVPHEDQELEHLRERVSEHIARRMARTYGITGWVQWTPELWLRERGLEYRRKRFWSRTEQPVTIPYDAVVDCEAQDGWFHVWANFQERAVVKVRASSPNFYPGWIVFERLLHAHARSIKPYRSRVAQ